MTFFIFLPALARARIITPDFGLYRVSLFHKINLFQRGNSEGKGCFPVGISHGEVAVRHNIHAYESVKADKIFIYVCYLHVVKTGAIWQVETYEIHIPKCGTVHPVNLNHTYRDEIKGIHYFFLK